MNNLEKITNSSPNNKKPDWKQWIPGLGIHYIQKAIENDEPKISDRMTFEQEDLLHLYHGIAIGVEIGIPMVYGIYKMIEFF